MISVVQRREQVAAVDVFGQASRLTIRLSVCHLALTGSTEPRKLEPMSHDYGATPSGDTIQANAAGLQQCALEHADFPFDYLSKIAELESWRKEINRPIYHLHKWWAQRLGSAFRGILIGALETDPAQVLPSFYAPTRYPDTVIFDPFMGSGTTIGEGLKLGMQGIGRDINPVAVFAVRNALSKHSRAEVITTFAAIERDVAARIQHLYRATQPDGTTGQTLYYFWVKVVPCPVCTEPVDLFASYVFAKHAYPSRHPEARILCPSCGEINVARHDSTTVTCRGCYERFNPQVGPAQRQHAACPRCGHAFAIAQAVRRRPGPPDHRLYAKLVLLPDGSKTYQGITDADRALYDEAARALKKRSNAYPVAAILPGYNTDQVLGYQYSYWHEMFNERQLLALSILGERIAAIESRELRDLFCCLFSGTLEFNNMFASYKGEGTGAVRHMFAHHILKPQRTPLEANVWGTPKSSGSFSTLFQSRVLRALEYQDQPFELRPIATVGKARGEKVFGLSNPMDRPQAATYEEFSANNQAVYLSCGDSASTDLPDASVDLVVTDPPFFDNVHYSELADFFYVWQQHLQGNHKVLDGTTRSSAEVQSGDAATFARRLQGVYRECHRVLRPGGLLIFTYHHSRPEGWQAILEAVSGAGFVVTAAQPIKAEMSVAAPKAQAKQPIDLDVVMVCRQGSNPVPHADLSAAVAVASEQIQRFSAQNRVLSRNDVRVIVMAQILRIITQRQEFDYGASALREAERFAEQVIDRLFEAQTAVLGERAG